MEVLAVVNEDFISAFRIIINPDPKSLTSFDLVSVGQQ